MEKILKKYTTIPSHLYVNRGADTQLKHIIEEMQRPGYVLVARQMGKTNLLFNAKRTLENENRIFAYVDLSNLYDNERDCYQNIINCIIEPNPNIFDSSINDEIEKIRNKKLPPHNEYSRSLILILNNIKGDLVIILDEIDALRSAGYSDNIFAQIRSNYFSRTNFPIFERLTYVLSGVIEPTELIKDKNKSPFNIGDKIYLDDFTKLEFDDFIEKSKLSIPSNISDHIYSWTKGNPRLTFDVCAEVEIRLNNQSSIDVNDIDEIVNKKYLKDFDIAPVDHIRELAKSNKEIQRAIVKIHNGELSAISDDIRKRLYLYGIIGSEVNGEISIKNRIIECCLSLDWLKSISKEVTLFFALGKYSEKNYTEALEIFKELIDTSKNDTEIESSKYFAGMCLVKIKDYISALEYFSYDYVEQEHKDNALAFLGVCQIANNELENGISTLRKAVQKETHSHAYRNALLNLAMNTSDQEESLNLLEKLYDSTFKAKDPESEDIEQLRSISLYYQAEKYIKRNEKDIAISKIDEALEICKKNEAIFLFYIKSIISEAEDNNTKKALVDLIISNKLRFEEGDIYPISFTEKDIYLLLRILICY